MITCKGESHTHNLRTNGWARAGRRCVTLLSASTVWGIQERKLMQVLSGLWREQDGQDIAEYAVMLAVILVIVVGTIRLIGSNANTVFSGVASSIQ
jgi:Flp pilus assembly pilin Flp